MTQAGAVGSLRIRACGARHAGELAGLHASLFDEGWDAASFKEMLAHPGAIAFAADASSAGSEMGRQAWGFIVGRVVADEAEVITLGVARDRQRRGIAWRLVEKLCQAAARRGARRVYLEVAEDNLAARALYARLGFTESGRRRGYYVRTHAPAGDAINLSRTLETFAVSDATIGRRSGPRL
jgi:ribosomal-protein-alanine N-acetyltransferase